MAEKSSAELQRALDANPDAAIADAERLEALGEPLQEISTELRRLASDLGLEGMSGDAAQASIADTARSMLAKVDALAAIAVVVKEAASTVETAQSEYRALPLGRLTYAERRELEANGASTGIPYIENARAQEREREAAAALSTVNARLNELSLQVKGLADQDRQEEPTPKNPGDDGGGRTPRTPYVPPSVPNPGVQNPVDPPGGGGRNPDPDPVDTPVRPPVTYEPPETVTPYEPPETGTPVGPTPITTEPVIGNPRDTHGDDRPSPGSPVAPVVGGPAIGGGGIIGGDPGSGGTIGGPGAGGGTIGGPGSGGVAGGALAGGAVVGGTALGAMGAARIGGGALGGAMGGVLAGTPGAAGGVGGAAVLGGGPAGAGAAGRGGALGAAAGAGGRGGATNGMVGAAGGGAAGSSKRKRRAGSLGYVAPELDEDEPTTTSRSAGLARGSREDAPKVTVSTPEEDETW